MSDFEASDFESSDFDVEASAEGLLVHAPNLPSRKLPHHHKLPHELLVEMRRNPNLASLMLIKYVRDNT